VDPRRAYSGPLRNVRPDVRYVGADRCAACHPDKAETYRQHPMGRSLAAIAELAPCQPYDARHKNPFEAFGSRFLVDRQGERVRHRQSRLDASGQPVYRADYPVHYVIGSGRSGFSYLTEHDGYLFQTPISWYSQKERWDVSPGFDAERLTGRPVSGDCLFCHANRAHSLDSYQNRYEKPIFTGHAIGCERCHGPGELHVRSRDAQDIVHPGKLPADLREAVCQQCHLEGTVRVLRRGRGLYDFRPGLPLGDFWSIFVRPRGAADDGRAVNHVEQMYLSKCFLQTRAAASSDKKLGCISCHDPHVYVGPERRVDYYRRRCLTCHEERPCAVPGAERRRQDPADSCIDCHMPRQAVTNVAHTAATDHRIVRWPRQERPDLPELPGAGPLLVAFGRERLDPRDREQARDAGLALVKAASNGRLPQALATGQALELLRPALRNFPDDVEAWEARGWALLAQKSARQGLTAFEEVLIRDPQRERSLLGAALLAETLDLADKALGYWRRCAAVNPWLPLYRRHLALLLMRKQAWNEVRPQAQAWLRLDPGSTEARMLWITCLLRDGRKAEAAAEFARIEALRPPDLSRLRALYQAERRGGSR